MRRRRRMWLGLLCAAVVAVAGVSPRAMAGETGTDTSCCPSRADAVWRKLGRGIANMATCPLELMRVPTLVGRQDGYLAAMSVGLLQGAWQGIVRGVAGIVEVGTFFVEVPKNYAPLVTPEFVWRHGSWAE